MESQFVATNGIRLNVVQAGPEEGPLVLLLHGFPEFSYGWRKQIPALVEAGYRVWAPDQRGYNLSDKPKGVAAYALDQLGADITGLMDAAGVEKAYVVGHDWGGLVTWWLGVHAADRLEKMVVLNAPLGSVFRRHLQSSRKQLLKSWYVLFFQLPWLPEAFSRAGNWRNMARSLAGTSRRGTFSEADLAEYRRAWSQPRAFQSMINWYRAIFRTRSSGRDHLPVQVPTLLIWGAKDRFLGSEMAQASVALCQLGRLEQIDGATHWVQHEEPEKVNSLILDFLTGGIAS